MSCPKADTPDTDMVGEPTGTFVIGGLNGVSAGLPVASHSGLPMAVAAPDGGAFSGKIRQRF